MIYRLAIAMQHGIKNLWMIYGEKRIGYKVRILISSAEYLTTCLSLI
ncbi:Uncharacterised protein [Enterobacter hormaechei]|nr:Uncharacterised protein [Enterobacter hormaechei]